MNKYIIFLASFVLLLIPFVSSAEVMAGGGDTHCPALKTDLGYGMNDKITNDKSIYMLQVFLNNKKYLFAEPTGFFGTKTQKAVISFQNANNIISIQPGFVGSTTRAKIITFYCDTAIFDADYSVGKSKSNSDVTVLIPNGWEVWENGSNQNIKWSDKIDGYNHDLALVRKMCFDNVCNNIVLNYIVKNIKGSSYSWKVHMPEKDFKGNNYYKVNVCRTGTKVCDTSDLDFMITTPLTGSYFQGGYYNESISTSTPTQ